MDKKREYNFGFGSKRIAIRERELVYKNINVSYVFIQDMTNGNNKDMIKRTIKDTDEYGNIYKYLVDNRDIAWIEIDRSSYIPKVNYSILCENKAIGKGIVREYLSRTDYSNMINYEALGLLTEEEIANRNELLRKNFSLIHTKKVDTDMCISRAS